MVFQPCMMQILNKKHLPPAFISPSQSQLIRFKRFRFSFNQSNRKRLGKRFHPWRYFYCGPKGVNSRLRKHNFPMGRLHLFSPDSTHLWMSLALGQELILLNTNPGFLTLSDKIVISFEIIWRLPGKGL